MKDFEIGCYVLYERQPGVFELGRVAKVTPFNCYVCYHEGCTAACTPKDKLFQIENEDVIECSTLGYHRFDDACDAYDPEVCGDICNEKAVIE